VEHRKAIAWDLEENTYWARGCPIQIRRGGNRREIRRLSAHSAYYFGQPCPQIGAAAVALMLDRIEHPDMLVRDVLLDRELAIRQSCSAGRRYSNRYGHGVRPVSAQTGR
jgi:hypothetical protein